MTTLRGKVGLKPLITIERFEKELKGEGKEDLTENLLQLDNLESNYALNMNDGWSGDKIMKHRARIFTGLYFKKNPNAYKSEFKESCRTWTSEAYTLITLNHGYMW